VGEDVQKISEKVSSLAEGDGPTLVIDLSDLELADSSGLGAFVFSWKLVQSKNKRLLFMNPRGPVKELLGESGLDKVFTIVDSLDGL
jgi:anti-sigma B factor antagonist